MITRGHVVVVLMFTIAGVLGLVAVWWHDQQGDRAQEFWGTRIANLIRHAPRVEALRLEEGGSAPVSERELHFSSRAEISGRPGLVHARHALIDDGSFLWPATAGKSGDWDYALRFADGEQTVTVLLDSVQGRVRALPADRHAQLAGEIRQALVNYLAGLFEPRSAPSGTE